jgi:hypothetical protein
MAMLTHDLDPPLHSPPLSHDAAKANLTRIKRACLVASTLLLAGTGLAAIIALKTAIYFARFHL